MVGSSLMSSVGRAIYVEQLGDFLSVDVGIGVMPCDFDGGILYGSMESAPSQMLPLVAFDGSDRDADVAAPDLSALKGGCEPSPFISDVFALQKAIEVPLGDLIRDSRVEGVSRFASNRENAVFGMRLEKMDELSARELLAMGKEGSALGSHEEVNLIANDIMTTARLLLLRDSQVDVNAHLLNSAALFASLPYGEAQQKSVRNFFAAASCLFKMERYAAAAILAEAAAEICDLTIDDEAPSFPFGGYRNLAVDAWDRSTDVDRSEETYFLRLYRGMRDAATLEGAYRVDPFLQKSMRMNFKTGALEEAAADSMRRAWFGAKREPMNVGEWRFVASMIMQAVKVWESLGINSIHLERAKEFAALAGS